MGSQGSADFGGMELHSHVCPVIGRHPRGRLPAPCLNADDSGFGSRGNPPAEEILLASRGQDALQRGVGWLVQINAERDSLREAYIGFVVRHNGEHPCASRLSPSALSPLPGWHGRKPCRRTITRTNPSPAPAARFLPRRRISCNRKAGPAPINTKPGGAPASSPQGETALEDSRRA